MAVISHTEPDADAVPPAGAPGDARWSPWGELGTMFVAFWMVSGLFIDGWAHNNNKPETFFTPWHGVLYSGFGAAVAWGVLRGRLDRRAGRDQPPGYALGGVGLLIFGLGGGADVVWHQIFGIEVNLEALLSPSHLMLFVGGLLALTSTFRAGWALLPRRVTFGRLFPVLLSLTLSAAVVSFFVMYANALTGAPVGPDIARYTVNVTRGPSAAQDFRELFEVHAIVSFFIPTVLLMGATFLLMRRWTPPFGSLTFMFSTVGVLLSGVEGFEAWHVLPAALAAGLVGDVLVWRGLSPRYIGGIVPAVMWLTWFAAWDLRWEVGWSPELWTGTTAFCALIGIALSIVAFPPPVPAEVAAVATPT